jgi:hypothetical protein
MSPLPWTQISLFPSWTLIFFKLKSQFPNCNLKNLSCPGGEDLGLWSVLLSTSRVRILLVPFMCWASPPPASGQLNCCPQISWSLGWILYLKKKNLSSMNPTFNFPRFTNHRSFSASQMSGIVEESQILLRSLNTSSRVA